MTLREDLARRLHGLVTPPPHLGTDPAESPFWLALADECVRQMEWARREGFDAGSALAMGGGGSDALTLAPEEWRP